VAGTFALVLHAHLPYVRHPEHAHSVEEAWLFEAVADCYLPLLDVFSRLAEEGIAYRVTVSLSPTLLAMWSDELLRERCARYLHARCELGRREMERTVADAGLREVAAFHARRFEGIREWYEVRFRRDLTSAFRRLADGGYLELATTAATHAFLPILQPPEAVRAQIALGVRAHAATFGKRPLGFWLPECGYAAGLEEPLAAEGIRYTFLDSHALGEGASRARFGVYAPVLTESGVAVFARDPESSEQVWSGEVGYPADPLYREFHRDLGFELAPERLGPVLRPAGRPGFTGFKYHRVTGSEPKELYDPAAGEARAMEHARHFAARRLEQSRLLERAMQRPAAIVAPYDAELFGHWWFEGPRFLEAVLRELSQSELRLATPADVLRGEPLLEVGAPAASSWGKGGDDRTWLNPRTGALVHSVNRAGLELRELVSSFGRLARSRCSDLRQAARELLLAQASDWLFLVANQTFAGYAEARVREHLEAFGRLASGIRSQKDIAGLVSDRARRWPIFEMLDVEPFAEASDRGEGQ